MADFIASANMSLPIPVVGVDPSPTWGTDLNSSLTIIDGHDHSSGSGVQITPAGININSDFSINQNDLTLVRTVRFDAQSVVLSDPADLGCLYEVGVDLYYNDGLGNQIRITQSGGVAGSPGSIAGLTSPASATYVSANQTFVWQSDASTAANLDAGSIIIRKITASSAGITISAPSALASNFTLTLPAALPASQKFVTIDASGNVAASWAVDNSTLEVSSNTVQVKDLGITAAKIANGSITQVKMGSLGQQVSSSSSTFNTTSTSFVDVTNLSVTLTTTGRPVAVCFCPDPAFTGSALSITKSGTPAGAQFRILRDSTTIATTQMSISAAGASITGLEQLPGSLNLVDFTGAGTFVYKLQAKALFAGTTTVEVQGVKLAVYEL